MKNRNRPKSRNSRNSPKIKNMSNKPQPPNQELGKKPQEDEKIDEGRRRALQVIGGLIGGTLIGGPLACIPKSVKTSGRALQDKLQPPARPAPESRPAYKETEPEPGADKAVYNRQERLGGEKKIIPDRLTERNEILLMDESMKIFMKHFIYPSFWTLIAAQNKTEEAENVLRTVMNHRGELTYEKTEGILKIKKRPNSSISGPLEIEINHGIITKINDISINPNLLVPFDTDWHSLTEKIRTLSSKMVRATKKDKFWKNTPDFIIADWERIAFEQFGLWLPHQLRKALSLKGGAISGEATARNALESALVNHPKTLKEMKKQKKNPTVYVGKKSKSPEGTVTLYDSRFSAIGSFDKDGFLMSEDKSDPEEPQWKRTDTRQTPFADTYR